MNELARRPLPHMDADEFLAWPGDGSGRKFHLIDGEVWAMSPARRIHGGIQANLAHRFLSAIEHARTSLSVVSEGAIVPALDAQDNVRVPDIVVSSTDGGPDDIAVTTPVLLVEILSPGNRHITRDNVRAYATLASVREIVVVDTTRIRIEVHARDPAGVWPDQATLLDRGDRLRLPGLGLDCPVERVYARTSLLRAART